MCFLLLLLPLLLMLLLLRVFSGGWSATTATLRALPTRGV
jgi:hypothetical protein